MNRYTPTANDRLISTSPTGARTVSRVVSVDGPEVTYERPDGVTVRTLVTTLRGDLRAGTFALGGEN